MKRSWIRRGSSRLQRRTPLRRYTPLGGSMTTVPADVRAALRERSGGRCEVVLPGCWVTAVDAHHRALRKGGGRCGPARELSDRLSNLLHVCRFCHDAIHARPAAAGEGGRLLKGYEIPPFEIVLYRGTPVYLADDGQAVRFDCLSPS